MSWRYLFYLFVILRIAFLQNYIEWILFTPQMDILSAGCNGQRTEIDVYVLLGITRNEMTLSLGMKKETKKGQRSKMVPPN